MRNYQKYLLSATTLLFSSISFSQTYSVSYPSPINNSQPTSLTSYVSKTRALQESYNAFKYVFASINAKFRACSGDNSPSSNIYVVFQPDCNDIDFGTAAQKLNACKIRYAQNYAIYSELVSNTITKANRLPKCQEDAVARLNTEYGVLNTNYTTLNSNYNGLLLEKENILIYEPVTLDLDLRLNLTDNNVSNVPISTSYRAKEIPYYNAQKQPYSRFMLPKVSVSSYPSKSASVTDLGSILSFTITTKVPSNYVWSDLRYSISYSGYSSLIPKTIIQDISAFSGYTGSSTKVWGGINPYSSGSQSYYNVNYSILFMYSSFANQMSNTYKLNDLYTVLPGYPLPGMYYINLMNKDGTIINSKQIYIYYQL